MIISLTSVLGPEVLSLLVEADDTDVARNLLQEALLANERFRRAVHPIRFGDADVILIDAQAPHLDSRLLTIGRDGRATRADVEVFCFLADPASYTGGELVIDTGYGDVAYREAIGACIVCPTASKRRLNPVTVGASRIARIQVQSCIRDVQQRVILYDLTVAADFFSLAGMTEPSQALRRSHDRLFGLWADA